MTKTVWYCPCNNCKTPKGLQRKFFSITTLFTHITKDHPINVETKLMYKLRDPEKLLPSVGKKRSVEDYEDGFKEILSVEEEEESMELENAINEIIKSTENLNIKNEK
mmetsp:Transcript_5743/g.7978  ORF Transcript_5743/g.7978 Transcript_5743/m.7978 type:complete len:108 (+) Transcript_5743:156-479(+)